MPGYESQNPADLSLDVQRVDMPTDATGDGFGVIVVDISFSTALACATSGRRK